jgi:hypothetical protein
LYIKLIELIYRQRKEACQIKANKKNSTGIIGKILTKLFCVVKFNLDYFNEVFILN